MIKIPFLRFDGDRRSVSSVNSTTTHLRRLSLMLVVGLMMALVSVQAGDACTNLLVSRGATEDGSVFLSFTVDGPGLSNLRLGRAQTEAPEVVDGERTIHHELSYPTNRTIGFMNEYQVGIGETTLVGGRHELVDDQDGGINYGNLMFLSLARSKTARECIQHMTSLVEKYGYSSEPEAFSISDKNEIWIMEMVGKGKGVKGAVWVAARVPDGYATAHANISRITTFPLDDPENWLYSPDVIDFAVEKGYYSTETGEPFSFKKAYYPNISYFLNRACTGRIWSLYRRMAPSQNFSSDKFHNDRQEVGDYPLFVKPDKKINVGDVMGLMRDHFEGTPFDMTKGVAAGPFASPYRYRGLTWEIEDKKYAWERPISSQQAACTFITQSRNWLPDAIGGVYWYTPDDPYASCFAPFYCGIDDVSIPYKTGDHEKFSWDSAWWISNFVSNFAYNRWSKVIPDVQAAQKEQEERFIKMQPIIDETALKLSKVDEDLMNEYLQSYTISSSDALFRTWRELAESLLTKYNDGYVHKPDDTPAGVGYPKAWYKYVTEDRGDQYFVEDVKPAEEAHEPAKDK